MMKRLVLLFVAWLGAFAGLSQAAEETRPNILWFVVDDMSAQFSCYGESLIATPHVDRLAREGLRFTDAHVTAPVCSTCRSAFMTGMYQASVGVHHHRSGRDVARIELPSGMASLPVLFRNAGYYTCNGDGLPDRGGKRDRNKTDYNFFPARDLYDSTDWAGRKPGQPFFMQVQMAGGKLRGANAESFRKIQDRARTVFGNVVDPAAVTLPSYYPRDPVLLRDWAAYMDSVRLTDHHVGQVIERLREEGVLEDTLVVFMTDHGISHARGKQFLYREGTHIPFVVRGPGVPQGVVRTDPIEHIDMAALSLAAAGIPVPGWMQGRDILAEDYQVRKAVFSARDRCDETVEMLRSVRTGSFLYIRNYHPFRPHLQPSRYKDGKAIVQRLRSLYHEDALSPMQRELLFQERRLGEELYDLRNDPDETRNRVGEAAYQKALEEMRVLLDAHLIRTRDTGFMPEPYLADVAIDDSYTVYEYANSDIRYPIAELVRVANLATRGEVTALPALTLASRHTHPLIRYWGLLGMLVLGEEARVSLADIEAGLRDGDKSVRLMAAAVLGGLGETDRAGTFFLEEARRAVTDAHALAALDGLKFLDRPALVNSVDSGLLIKGEYSGRCHAFLSQGGLVYPKAPR